VIATKRPTDALLASLGVRLVLWMLVTRSWLQDLFTDGTRLAWHFDEHYHYMHEDAARITLLRYLQLPAWNPFQCGGIPGLANPQDVSLSPDFVLRLVFGTGAGRRLAALLFVVLGMEGTYRLARRYDASAAAAAMAGIAFGASGRFAGLVGDGWVFMFAFELMPWAMLAFELGQRQRSGWILGGVVMSWLLMCGGTYTVPYTGLLLGAMAVAHSVLAYRAKTSALAPWLCLAKIVALSVGLSAVRLVPLLAVVRGLPRYFYSPDSNWPGDVLAGLALRAGDEKWTSLLHTDAGGWNYIGSVVFGLAVVGVLALDRRALWLGVLAVFFGALACGVHTKLSPWALVHRLPLFSQLRAPYRFVVVAGLLLALVAARGLTRIEDALPGLLRWWQRRRPPLRPFTAQALVSVCAGVAAFGIAVFASHQVVVDHRLPPGSVYAMWPVVPNGDGFRQSRGNRWDAHVWPAADRGELACFEETEFPESPLLRADAPQEEYADPSGAAKVTRVSWSPNRLDLHVDARQPFDLLVNQNFHPAWRSSKGEVFSKEKLLAVHAPAGTYDVTLTYRDSRIIFGAVVSLGSLALALALTWPLVRRRLRAVGRLLASKVGESAPPSPGQIGADAD
jgi:hypothetical protein